MKKIMIMLAVFTLLLSACNALNPNNNNEDEHDSVTRNQTMDNVHHTPKADTGNLNNDKALNNNNGVAPRFLSENTKVRYNGNMVLLPNLEKEIQNKLEQENAGIEFHVHVEAEEDNTQ